MLNKQFVKNKMYTVQKTSLAQWYAYIRPCTNKFNVNLEEKKAQSNRKVCTNDFILKLSCSNI